MAKYLVRYVHNVTQICRCGCTQYSHRRPRTEADPPAYLGDVKRDSPVWGQGACSSARCAAVPVGDYDGTTPCLEFQHQTQEMEVDLFADNHLTEREALIAAKVISYDTKVIEVRRDPGGKVVVFPKNSVWHSIIMTPIKESA